MGASLEHQFAGLGYEHEVTYDFGVRHRERSAGSQLLAEEGNDRTIRAEHIAKACGDKLSDTLYFAVFDGLVKALHVYFANAL